MLHHMQESDANRWVGENVSALREARRWSQAELARRLAEQLGKPSLDPTTITRMESGKRPTTVAELNSLAKLFGVTEQFLLTPDTANVDQLIELRALVQDAADRARNLSMLAHKVRESVARINEIKLANPSAIEQLSSAELDAIEQLSRI